ncbi:ROK family protein [Mycoplasma corogypsi]|uniref:ROK family protein n=1 Tax=Mycoplasma corogypsi TaxID=2106 RepID=UPI00387335ED
MTQHLTHENDFAAVDIGGTNVRFALFNSEGKIKQKYKTQTNSLSAEITMDWIVQLVNDHHVKFLALCIPGPSDYENGIVHKSPNLGGSWENFDVKSYLLAKTKLLDIVFENDANVMAYANHVYYNCLDHEISQFFTISTGFGAGLVINNQIYHGNKYFAQEIAQLPVASKKFPGEYKLKSPYALELHCSGSGLATKAQYYNLAADAKTIFELAKQNSSEAKLLVDEATDALSKTFAITAALIAPNNYFIGGSIGLAEQDMVLAAFEKAKTISDFNHFHNVTLRFDKLGDDSALYGLYYLIKARQN